jgi:predicted alpha/beta-hydrolase family hydrolase
MCHDLQSFRKTIGEYAGAMASNRFVPDDQNLTIAVPDAGEVSSLFLRPENARWVLVLAHGAGAGMRHPFLGKLAAALATVDVATLRYQFPYMEQRRRLPDSPTVLTSSVRAAVKTASEMARDIPILAGGKSMGGRMTSQAAAEHPPEMDNVKGLIFFGFPLHPPGRPGTKRAEHLDRVRAPMLFLQGTRDQFADLKLLRPIVVGLGAGAALREFEAADHSFHVLKSSGKTDAQIIGELAKAVRDWADSLSQATSLSART